MFASVGIIIRDPLLRLVTTGLFLVGVATASVMPYASLVGVGRSRRNPKDQSIPQIGEELAAARALHDLAHHLEDDARSMIESYDPKFAGR